MSLKNARERGFYLLNIGSLDDRGYMKVKYWIDAVRAEILPPYEGEKPEKQTVTTLTEDADPEDGLPF